MSPPESANVLLICLTVPVRVTCVLWLLLMSLAVNPLATLGLILRVPLVAFRVMVKVKLSADKRLIPLIDKLAFSLTV